MRKPGIRTRMFLATGLPLALIGTMALYTAATSVSFASYLETLLRKNALLASIEEEVDGALQELSAYLSTKESDSLNAHLHSVQRLSDESSQLEKRVMMDEEARLERDAHALLERFVATSEVAVSMKRASRVPDYHAKYAQADEIASSLRYTLGNLENLLMKRRLQAISSFSTRIIDIQHWNMVLLGLLAALGLAVVLYNDLKLTDPIVHLSAAAERIAHGDFGGPEIPVESDDEIGTMTRGFNVMKNGIAKYIGDLRSKAEIESTLMEQKLKNLEMANLLKHAELSSMQSRINPHFLFNTLNAGIQLATIEDADRTRTFLEHLSAMMRYSTRGLDTHATLGEEFSSIESYAYLMDLRFPGRFSFAFSLAPEASSAPIPKLSIQPLVENSVQHGFSGEGGDARVTLSARSEGEDVVVEVEDNGVGFPEGLASSILDSARSGSSPYRPAEGGSESLGLVNVIRRLMLFTGRDDAVSIESAPGRGTLIRIRLPAEGDLA